MDRCDYCKFDKEMCWLCIIKHKICTQIKKIIAEHEQVYRMDMIKDLEENGGRVSKNIQYTQFDYNEN